MLKEGFLVKRVSALLPRARGAVGTAGRAVAGRADEPGSRWPAGLVRNVGSRLVSVVRGWLSRGPLKTTDPDSGRGQGQDPRLACSTVGSVRSLNALLKYRKRCGVQGGERIVKGYFWKEGMTANILWQKVNHGWLQLRVYSEIAKRILNDSHTKKTIINV